MQRNCITTRRRCWIQTLTSSLGVGFFLALCQCSIAYSGVLVAPAVYTASEAPSHTALLQPSIGRTFQYTVAASEFSSLTSGDEITGMAFRLNFDAALLPPATWTDFDIQLSKISTLTMSSTFDDNIGGDVVQVRAGSLSLALDPSFAGSSPNSFFDIPFDTPYPYTGDNLLVTIRFQGGAGFPLNTSSLDAIGTFVGGPSGQVATGYTAATAGTTGGSLPVTQFTFGVPEPSSVIPAAFGLVALATWRWRRKR